MNRLLPSAWTVYAKLVLTTLLWGIAWPVGRLLALGLPPISIAAIRYAVVVPVFFLLLHLKEHSVRIPRAWAKDFLAMGILNTSLYQAFFLFGVRYAAASDDSLVIGVGPVLIAVLAAAILGEPLTRLKIIGLVSGVSGVGIISLLSPNVAVLNRGLGVSLVFGGAVVYALYTVLLRKFINKGFSKTMAVARPSSLAIISWVSLFGWLFLIPFSLIEAPWNYSWDVNSWLGILYLALFSTVIGYLFYVDGVSQIGASRAAIFGNLVPVFGVLSSFALLNESISIWHGASFLLIFLGVVVVNRRQREKRSIAMVVAQPSEN
jgi:drug/metabolite transporter (DMT)-like permease